MINLQIIIIMILLLIILILFILFRIIYNEIKIEKFDNTPAPISQTPSESQLIPFKILMYNYSIIQPKPIDSNQAIYNYYSISEHIETSADYNYFFNIYYSYNTTNTGTISDKLFPNNSNYTPITLTAPKINRPIISDANTKNILINRNYIVVDFMNQYAGDTKFNISNISIRADNRTITNLNQIKFYYSDNTNNTINPNIMNLIEFKIYDSKSSIDTKNNTINIYDYYFNDSNNNILTIDDITIFFNTGSNNVTLYSININALSEIEYNTNLNKNKNDNDTIFDATDVDTIDLNTYNAEDSYKQNSFNSDLLTNIFTKILTNNMPWAAYNGADAVMDTSRNKIILPNLLGNKCRDAIINDPKKEFSPNNISTEDTYYMGNDESGNPMTNKSKTNIPHLKGTTNISIDFPQGSFPYNYTLCAVTAFYDMNQSAIITTKNSSPINFTLGNTNGNDNGVVYNNNNININNINNTYVINRNNFIRTNFNWTVNCVKTRGNQNTRINTNYNTVISNGIPYGTNNFIGNGYSTDQTNTENILCINGMNGISKSNFRLSYFIIWPYILSDTELDLVSKCLINSLRNNCFTLPFSLFKNKSKNDGSFKTSAVNSPMDIIANSCDPKDGYYWINLNNNSSNNKCLTYCILDNRVGNFGTGWLLAMKGAIRSLTFKYSSEHWTNPKTTFNPFNFTNSDGSEGSYTIDNLLSNTSTDIKTDIFNYYKFTEILIIYNHPNFSNKKYYKTSYYKLHKKYDKSLADFFANNLNDFIYTNDTLNLKLQPQHIVNYSPDSKISRLFIPLKDFINNYLADPNGFNYTPDVFSYQNICAAYGMNLNFNSGPWGQLKARIGAIFNENPGQLFNSCDVVGGIGLNGDMNNFYGYSSGNYIGCCQDKTRGSQNKITPLPFLLFVR